MSVRFLFAIYMMAGSCDELPVLEPLSPNKDDGFHFDIPPGTTRITLDSWARWGVKPHLVTSITIPDSVTVIERQAFANCSSLSAVTIPSSVTVIERRAFLDCESLTEVDIPDSVTVIQEEAFAGCSSLTALTIPSSVTVIEKGAFAYCESLAAVAIPNSVTVIKKEAFAGCSSLTAVTIPRSVTVIEERAFAYCRALTALTIPSSVTVIEKGAFYNCYSLTAVEIPDSVTVIKGVAFSRCSSLAAVTIPSSVTVINENAFAYCSSLAAVTISEASVTELADNAFRYCISLRTFDYGWVTDLAAPNRFPALNRAARTATVEHPLENGDSCVVRCTWPASSAVLEQPFLDDRTMLVLKPETYAGTEPGPVTEVVDATGIASPILLIDLGGNEYPVHGCWAANRSTADFKALAAAQHPEVLGETASWAVLLPDADAAVDTLDPAAVALMLARGELSLAEPWLLVWKSGENENENENEEVSE